MFFYIADGNMCTISEKKNNDKLSWDCRHLRFLEKIKFLVNNKYLSKNIYKKNLYNQIYQTQCLKLVSTIFYQIFIFSPNDNLSKIMKNVFYFI